MVELRLQHDTAKGKDKKILQAKIREAEDLVKAMKIARKSMLKFQGSFGTGLELDVNGSGEDNGTAFMDAYIHADHSPKQ